MSCYFSDSKYIAFFAISEIYEAFFEKNVYNWFLGLYVKPVCCFGLGLNGVQNYYCRTNIIGKCLTSDMYFYNFAETIFICIRMSVNKVILIGNIGKEPDVRHLDRNVVVANMVLATTERAYTLQNGTQVPERTEWHNIVLWGGLAEVAEKYVHKGDRIYIEAKIRTNTYEDQNGIRRYRTEILAETMEMLSSKTGMAPADVTPSGSPF